jgi:hypothetical protein
MSHQVSPAGEEYRRHALDSWVEELNFYESEINSCELSLEQFVLGMKTPEELAATERFQNQFIHQREVINDLKFKVRQYARSLEDGEADDPELTERQAHYLQLLAEEIEIFRGIFNELLAEFDRFVSGIERPEKS